MYAKEIYPKNMYEVKSGNTYAIVKCDDQMKLEYMVENNMIDEYRMLKVFKI